MTDRPKDFLGIHDWNDHQPPEADEGRFIRVYTRLLVLDKWRSLSLAQQGLLTSLWLYRGVTGRNPPRAPEALRRSLGGPRDKHLGHHVKILLAAPFVYLTSTRCPVQRDKKGRPGQDQVMTTGHETGQSPEQVGGGRERKQAELVRLERQEPTAAERMLQQWRPMFTRFWRVWPKKVARIQAEKAWHQIGLQHLGLGRGKLTPQELAANVEAVLIRRQEDDWSERSKDKLPNPATFLRAEAFDNQSRLEVTS